MFSYPQRPKHWAKTQTLGKDPSIGHPDKFANLPAGCFQACWPLGIDPVTEAQLNELSSAEFGKNGSISLTSSVYVVTNVDIG